MFKKQYYGSKIAPACAYCLYGMPASDPKMVLCRLKGVVSPYYSCRRFEYDPLLRKPKPPAVLPEYDPEEFQL